MRVVDNVFGLQGLDREAAAAPTATAEVKEHNMVINCQGLDPRQKVAMADVRTAMENYQCWPIRAPLTQLPDKQRHVANRH